MRGEKCDSITGLSVMTLATAVHDQSLVTSSSVGMAMDDEAPPSSGLKDAKSWDSSSSQVSSKPWFSIVWESIREWLVICFGGGPRIELCGWCVCLEGGFVCLVVSRLSVKMLFYSGVRKVW